MDKRFTSNKQVLVNISIALLIPFIHWIYGEKWTSLDSPFNDFWRGLLIIFILLLGVIGAIKEIFELRYIIKSHLGWFFLTLLATAGHIILYLAALNFLGFDFSGEMSGTTNALLIAGSLFFAFFFLFELLFIFSHEVKKDNHLIRKYTWSDVLLSLYAAFGSVYIWDIYMGDILFKFESLMFFLIGELLPATVLFLLLIFPFKRYDILGSHGAARTRKEKLFLYLSYLAIIISALMPRIFESAGISF